VWNRGMFFYKVI